MDGTATTADGDYTSNSNTLTFAPGVNTQQITVVVNGDTKFENNETFTVHLSGATNATISDADGLGTITNDDAAPTFSIDDVTHNEGNAGTTTYTFTVTKTGSTALTATVDYRDAGRDGHDSRTTITSPTRTRLPSDQASPPCNSRCWSMATRRWNRTRPSPFICRIATNATISDADGTGTINNDDVPPSRLTT